MNKSKLNDSLPPPPPSRIEIQKSFLNQRLYYVIYKRKTQRINTHTKQEFLNRIYCKNENQNANLQNFKMPTPAHRKIANHPPRQNTFPSILIFFRSFWFWTSGRFITSKSKGRGNSFSSALSLKSLDRSIAFEEIPQ
jgi:hypothetical protein